MQDRMTEDKPTRVPARANRWWNQPSAIGLGGTEGLTGVLGDRAKSVLLLERAPTDWKAGCGRSARPVWEGGGAHRAPPILILPSHTSLHALIGDPFMDAGAIDTVAQRG